MKVLAVPLFAGAIVLVALAQLVGSSGVEGFHFYTIVLSRHVLCHYMVLIAGGLIVAGFVAIRKRIS